MTIGVGFLDAEDVVLGCDMEMTGGTVKYRGNKDYYGTFDSDGRIAAVYSGQESDMRAIWEKLEEWIDEKQRDTSELGIKGVRQILDRAVEEVIGKKKSTFEMLIGVCKARQLPSFLKVFGNKVFPAGRWEVIGYGNSELAHYLIQMFDEKGPNSLEQAILWMIHVIQTANRFVQYVGQGVRIIVLSNGKMAAFDGAMFSARLMEIERRISDIWYNACDTRLSSSEMKDLLGISVKDIVVMRDAFPKVMQYVLKDLKEQSGNVAP